MTRMPSAAEARDTLKRVGQFARRVAVSGWASPTPALKVAGQTIVAAAVALAVGLYLSGSFLLMILHQPPHQATPLTILQYAHYYGDRPEVLKPLQWSLGMGMGAVALIVLLIVVPKKRPLHGEARWARKEEIQKAGLLAQHGLILGKYGNRYLTLGGQQGVLLAAPPRSGKGVGIVIPNLLNWKGSVLCVDIKGENHERTAAFRANHGQEVHVVDFFLTNGRSSRWNPLDYVSDEPARRIDDIQRMAEMFYPNAPTADPFWTNSARTVFLGIALYLFERRDRERELNAALSPDIPGPEVPVTLGEILRQAMGIEQEGFGAHWKRVIEGRAAHQQPLSDECVRALYDVIHIHASTASSIRKTFTSRLDLWLNPMLDAATSASDFDLRDLRKRPMSIYVTVNPDDMARLEPVLNLFFQQAIGLQTRERPETNPELKHQLLLLLDEFTALGKLPIFTKALGFIPGYNLRTIIVIQSYAQLRELYGREGAAAMIKTLAVRIVFAAVSVDDAQEISEELGYTTVKVHNVSRPGAGSGKHRGRTLNESDQRRALLLPQEVKELGPDKQIVFYENLRPVLCKKIRYFKDPHFARREHTPPQVPSVDVSQRRMAPPDPLAMPKPAEPLAASAAPHPPTTGGDGTEPTEPKKISTHPFSIADVARLEILAESEFSVAFDAVEIPEGREVSEAQIRQSVDQFIGRFVAE